MHVAASENDRGICWVIAKAAEKQGMDVTMNDALKPDAIKNIAHKIDSNSCLIDCLVCSSDLHPADVDVLLQKITKGEYHLSFYHLNCNSSTQSLNQSLQLNPPSTSIYRPIRRLNLFPVRNAYLTIGENKNNYSRYPPASGVP